MPSKIFISYAAEDAEVVYRVWDILSRIGIQCYAYEKFPKPGEAISESVMKAIKVCRYMIVFLTKNSSESHWVNQEVGAAVALNKRVIPILENGTEWTGFIANNVEHIRYNPLKPDFTISVLIRRLREIFKLDGAISRGFEVRCGSCKEDFQADLPSNIEVEDAAKEKRNFHMLCPNGHIVEISASTLEPTWLRKEFEKTIFKKKVMRMITLLAQQNIPSILIESISALR
jgi:hypothetical protein